MNSAARPLSLAMLHFSVLPNICKWCSKNELISCQVPAVWRGTMTSMVSCRVWTDVKKLQLPRRHWQLECTDTRILSRETGWRRILCSDECLCLSRWSPCGSKKSFVSNTQWACPVQYSAGYFAKWMQCLQKSTETRREHSLDHFSILLKHLVKIVVGERKWEVWHINRAFTGCQPATHVCSDINQTRATPIKSSHFIVTISLTNIWQFTKNKKFKMPCWCSGQRPLSPFAELER